MIWRCNAKYDDKEHRCSTPHLTEEEVKAAFIRAVNKLAADREFERFITTLESLPDEVTDFSEDLWGSLVEYLTVYAKDDLRFMLPCEVEIEA